MHVLLIPALLLALITAHLFIMFHQKHTQRPGPGRTEHNVVGQPLYPHFMAKTGAFFFAVFGVTALLATFAQINPVWLYGPYRASAVSAGSQPDFYLGALEGALRIMPSWHWDVLGVTVPFNVLIPATVPLGLILGGAAIWPFLERWITGDRREHHIGQRPRDVPTRTGIGVAAITFYGVLWLAGANDLIAYHFRIDLYTTTWIARIAVLAGPVVAYWVTKRICLGLQRQDAETLEHGIETGVIRQLPDGGYEEWTAPVPASQRAAVEARRPLPLPAAPGGGPAPPSRTLLGRLRLALNRILTESIPLPPAQPGDHDGEPGEPGRQLTSSRRHG
jgi:ubiquinol-cytochrome c reductase cytochrome b subunit